MPRLISFTGLAYEVDIISEGQALRCVLEQTSGRPFSPFSTPDHDSFTQVIIGVLPSLGNSTAFVSCLWLAPRSLLGYP
jgi:hypothetical protein